jgi:hypothetical protein
MMPKEKKYKGRYTFRRDEGEGKTKKFPIFT